MSVELLPEPVRPLYHTFGIFPEDVPVPQALVIKLWRQLEKTLRDRDGIDLLIALDRLGLIERNLENHTISLHDLLHDYTREKLGSRYVETQQQLLLAYNPQQQPWYEIPHDGYIYHNLAYHLIEAEQQDILKSLLVDSPRWMEASFVATVGFAAYAADIRSAMRHIEKKPTTTTDLITIVQLCTAYAVVNMRVGIYQDIDLQTLVLLGRTAEALTHARLRGTPEARCQGMLVVCKQLGNAADNVLLERIIEQTREIPDVAIREMILHQIAVLLADRGETIKAFSAIEMIQDAARYANAVKELACLLAVRGNTEVSDSLIRKVTPERRQAEVQQQVINALAATQNIEGALNRIETLPYTSWQLNALLQVAEVIGQQNNDSLRMSLFERAEKIAEVIEDRFERGISLAAIAEALANSGQTEPALKLIEKAENKFWCVEATYAVIKAFAKANQLPEALRLLKESQESLTAYLKIAEGLSECGQLNQLLLLIEELPSESLRSQMATVAALIFAQQGLREEAVILLNQLGENKAEISLQVAARLAEQGDPYAIDLLRTVGASGTAVNAVVHGYARCGKCQLAQQALRYIVPAERDPNTIYQVLEAFVSTSHELEALNLVQEIPEAESRVNALRRIAKQLAEHGASEAGNILEQALTVAQGVENSEEQALVLWLIINALIENGAVHELAYHIAEPSLQASALEKITRFLAQEGQDEAALATALKIEIEQVRSAALEVTVRALVGADHTTAAKEALEMISDIILRSLAEEVVATTLAKQGRTESIELAKGIRNPDIRTTALVAVARILAEVGNFDAGLMAARAIINHVTKATVLGEISVFFGKTGEHREGPGGITDH